MHSQETPLDINYRHNESNVCKPHNTSRRETILLVITLIIAIIALVISIVDYRYDVSLTNDVIGINGTNSINGCSNGIIRVSSIIDFTNGAGVNLDGTLFNSGGSMITSDFTTQNAVASVGLTTPVIASGAGVDISLTPSIGRSVVVTSGSLNVNAIVEKTVGSGTTIMGTIFSGNGQVSSSSIIVPSLLTTNINGISNGDITINGIVLGRGSTVIPSIGAISTVDFYSDGSATFNNAITCSGLEARPSQDLTLSGASGRSIIMNTKVKMDTIIEKTTNAGVNAGGVLLKLGGITMATGIALNYYNTGFFTPNFTGAFNIPVVANFTWARVGSVVTLTLNSALSGQCTNIAIISTSDGVVPNAILPPRNQEFVVWTIDNGNVAAGSLNITVAGGIMISKDYYGAFSNSGMCGSKTFSVSYIIL